MRVGYNAVAAGIHDQLAVTLVSTDGDDRLVFRSIRGYNAVLHGPPDSAPDGVLRTVIDEWLSQDWPEERAEPNDLLPLAIEAFYIAWWRFAEDAQLDPDDRRTGNALATMANEVAKSENPPRGVLRAAFDWFAHKADVFADSAVKAGGAAFGGTFGVGIGAAASGQLPHLLKAIEAVRGLLG